MEKVDSCGIIWGYIIEVNIVWKMSGRGGGVIMVGDKVGLVGGVRL